MAILNGISFMTSQKIKIDINSSNSLRLNISENSSGYFHKSIDCKNKYCYSVEQTISGTLNFIQYHGVSVSNKLCVNQRNIKVPPIKSLLVSTEDNRNRVYFEDDSGWPLKKERWFLYKNEGVKSIIIDTVTNYQEFLKDTTLVEKSESYKIGYIDQCNSNSFLSDSVSSIYLKFSSPNKIFWTENSPFSNSGVNVYKIFHVDEQTNLPVLNKEILNSKYETDLDLSSFEDYAKLFIRSEAVVGGNTLVSNSNLLEVPIAPSIYIPNVFTPNKDLKNDIFSIYTSNKSFLEFKMLIYNRNGEIVATLNSPAEIWDGTYKSNHVPQGTYIYKITATQKNGEKFFKLGSLNLIR
jgi:gliding motility-associated-like protein